MPEPTPAAPPRVAVILPALNEAEALRFVLPQIPRDLVGTIIVVDNGSTDATAEVARSLGARVVSEPRRGYGQACLAGIAALPPETEIVLFLDSDGSDYPDQARLLIEPIAQGRADLVLGSRAAGRQESGSVYFHQALANRTFVGLIRLLYGHGFTDLGPFRAVRSASLRSLGMADTNFGWTVEMQVKAVKRGLRVLEVPVGYRKRAAGVSKISGHWLNTTLAGVKIVWMILKLRVAG